MGKGWEERRGGRFEGMYLSSQRKKRGGEGVVYWRGRGSTMKYRKQYGREY